MRILVICQHYWPEPFRITEICETLVAHGHDVTALVGLPNYPSGIIPNEYRHFRRRREEINGVHVRRCFEIGRRNTKIGLAVNYCSYMLSASVKALLLKHDFDVVYAYSTSPVLMSLPAALLRCFSRTKLMIYVLDIWPACLAAMNVFEGSALYALMKRVSRWVYGKADLLAYSSKRFQAYLQNVHGITVPDEQYLPQFADALFEGVAPKTPGNGWDFIFAGNIGKIQGVETLLRAAALLRDEPIRWHILGDGANFEACKTLVHELAIDDKVTMYGRRPLSDMPAFYAMADAMLVSMKNDISVNDTLPGKVQSYMAAGKPILGSIAGETPYVLRQANCGLCAPPDDPAAFAEVVKTFTHRRDQVQMGENARAYCLAHFTREKHMEKLEHMLQTLCEENDG